MAKNNHIGPSSSPQVSKKLSEATQKLGVGFMYQEFAGETSSLEEVLAIAAQYSAV